MKDIKLVNLLKENVVEMYSQDVSSDIAKIEFGRANVWSKYDKPILLSSIFFTAMFDKPSIAICASPNSATESSPYSSKTLS